MFALFSNFKTKRQRRWRQVWAAWLALWLVVLYSPLPIALADEGETSAPPAETVTTPPPEVVSTSDSSADSSTNLPVTTADVPGPEVDASPAVDPGGTTEADTLPSDTTVLPPETTTSTTAEVLTGNQITLTATPLPSDAGTTTTLILPVATTSEATTTDDLALAVQPLVTSAAATTTEIITGQTVAVANVANVVNVNIYDSQGFLMFLDNLLHGRGTLDLRDLSFWQAPPPPLRPPRLTLPPTADLITATTSPAVICQQCGPGASVSNDNEQVTVNNSVIVRADSGGNQANGNAGEAVISTGDAYAAANVINVVNTNIVDSNYLLMTFNNFGNWQGDLVLPGAELFSRFFGLNANGPASPALPTTVDNTNASTTVANQVTVSADSGGNEANNNGGGGTIVTGDTTAATNVINQVNTNLTATDSFSIVFRVHGHWLGDVFSPPPGVTWQATADGGLELFLNPLGLSAGSSGASPAGAATVSNNNQSTTINNDVQVYALTGANQANNNNGAATISTGQAGAAANIINVANTNVVGRNWFLAIVNIFGDWMGNVAFGRPNLWIGQQAKLTANPLRPDQPVTYDFTIINNGDAVATDVVVTDHLATDLLTPVAAPEFTMVGDQLTWHLPPLAPGQSTTVSFQAKARDDLPYGETAANNTVTVTAHETDEDETDNTDAGAITLQRDPPSYAYYGGSPAPATGPSSTIAPLLQLIKTSQASTTPVQAGDAVHYQVVIKNQTAGPLYQATMIDQLTNEAGQVIHEETWPLDTIAAHEEITLGYDTLFSASSTSGVYTNYAWVEGQSYNPDPAVGTFYQSPTASSTITLQSNLAWLLTDSTDDLVSLAATTSPVAAASLDDDLGGLGQLAGEWEEALADYNIAALPGLSLLSLDLTRHLAINGPQLAAANPSLNQLAGLFSLSLDRNWLWWLLILLLIAMGAARQLPRQRQRIASWFF